MEWNGMAQHGMEWSGMEWNGMGWDGMEWNGMEWNGMEWNGMPGSRDGAVVSLHHCELRICTYRYIYITAF